MNKNLMFRTFIQKKKSLKKHYGTIFYQDLEMLANSEKNSGKINCEKAKLMFFRQ